MNFKDLLKENRDFIIMAFFSAIFLVVAFLPQNKEQKQIIALKTDQVIEKKVMDYQSILNSIEAKSFYVYDILDQKPLFSKDEHSKLPLASITKLMSGLVILDIMPETTEIVINEEDLSIEGNSGFALGEKWKLKDLLDYSLMTSSNGGMHALSSALDYYQSINNMNTIKIMNERAATLNLKDTVFINETGLDVDGNMAGAYSSAYDVSRLFEKIIKDNPGLVISTKKQNEDFVSESNIKHTAVNTNISINKISGLMASKTGFTNLAGGNLAVVFDAGFMHPIVIVVLGSTTNGRFDDVIKLEKLALAKLSE